MWRIVYETAPKGGLFNGAGPWHTTKEAASYWLSYLSSYYPAARLQSWQEAYPKSRVPD